MCYTVSSSAPIMILTEIYIEQVHFGILLTSCKFGSVNRKQGIAIKAVCDTDCHASVTQHS